MIDPAFEERVRESFERWSSGDHSFDPEWTDPNVEIHSAVGQFSGTFYRGFEGLRQWVDDMQEVFDEWQLAVQEVDEFKPGRVLVVGTVHLRGRGSGATVDQPCAWLLDHTEGVLTRFEPFLNRVDEARVIASR